MEPLWFAGANQKAAPMSLVAHRSITADHTGFRAGERAHLVAWGDESGLEVSIKPPGADHSEGMIFVGYGEGVAHWTIYRADDPGQFDNGRAGGNTIVGFLSGAISSLSQVVQGFVAG